MQPVILDSEGTPRFRENRIVTMFLEKATEGKKFDLNMAEAMRRCGKFTDAESMQFDQLIGYGLSSFGGLSYVPPAIAGYYDDLCDKLMRGEDAEASK